MDDIRGFERDEKQRLLYAKPLGSHFCFPYLNSISHEGGTDMKFVIEGDPIPKARARVRLVGHKVWTFDPQEVLKKNASLLLIAKMKKAFDHPKKEIHMEASKLALNSVFHVEMTFYLPIPKSHSRTQVNRILWGFDEHTSKPDIDNLAKFYLDAANGILWPDDKQ